MQTEFVKDLDIFLEKAEYGINHTYQLHRDPICGVFIDASFQSLQDEEGPQLLFKTRIEVASPKFISSGLRWDSNGFPYEVETYLVDGQEVVVPFYRPLETGWRGFLLDVVEELKPLLLDETIPSTEFVIPAPLVEGLRKVAKNLREIVVFLKQKQEQLDANEQSAIDRHLGECSIWEKLNEDIGPALATYLTRVIFDQQEIYEKIQKEQTTKRHDAFVDADNKAINRLEKVLQEHKFKKGYVS